MKKQTKCKRTQRYYSASSFLSSYVKSLNLIVDKQPFLSIILTSCGIEYLGKCLSSSKTWDQSGLSQIDYEKAINELDAFKEYRAWLKPYSLYISLRCSPVHSLAPSTKLKFVNIGKNSEDAGVLIISAKQYLNDFSKAVKSFRHDKKSGGKSVEKPIIIVTDEGPTSVTSITQDYPSTYQK